MYDSPIIPIVPYARTYYDLPRYRKSSVLMQRHGRRSENILEGYWPACMRIDSSLSSCVYIPTSRGQVATREHPLVHSQRASQVGDKLPGKQTNRKPRTTGDVFDLPSLRRYLKNKSPSPFSVPSHPTWLVRTLTRSWASRQVSICLSEKFVLLPSIFVRLGLGVPSRILLSLLIFVKLEGLFHCHFAFPMLADANTLNYMLVLTSCSLRGANEWSSHRICLSADFL